MGMDDYDFETRLNDMDYVRKLMNSLSKPEPAPDGPMKRKTVDRDNPCIGCVDNWNRICDQYNRAYAEMILVDPVFEPCPLGDNCANKEVRHKKQG